MNSPQAEFLKSPAHYSTAKEDLNQNLYGLAQHAMQATDAACCSVMLIEGEREAARLKLLASTKPLSSDTSASGVAAWVLKHGSALLVADIERSEIRRLTHCRADLGTSLICVPIEISDHIVGVINLANHYGAIPFDESDMTISILVAALIGKSLQIERMRMLLRSRVSMTALAKSNGQSIPHLTDGSLHPAKTAKILGRSFYKDLADAGFEPREIIGAATEIIGRITEDVARGKKRDRIGSDN